MRLWTERPSRRAFEASTRAGSSAASPVSSPAPATSSPRAASSPTSTAGPAECIEDVRHVYGETLPIAIDSLDERARFAITVGAGQRAAFELVDRGSAERPSWQVVARVATGGEAGEVPEERRVRHWRRGQVEEILLSLLSAYERSLTRERSA